MPKFKNFDTMEAYLKKDIYNILFKSMDIERVLAEAMVQSVYETVYDAYDPVEYNRRDDDGGLADPRNMQITKVYLEGDTIKITFENLTKGNDSMKGELITPTIVEGLAQNWANADGVWSQPRDFISDTANRLRSNPTELLNAVKTALIKRGFQVK